MTYHNVPPYVKKYQTIRVILYYKYVYLQKKYFKYMLNQELRTLLPIPNGNNAHIIV